MYSDDDFRQLIKDHLTAASEEIFRVFKTITAEYQKEIGRQRKLLDTVLRPEIRLHRTEVPQQHVCKEEGSPTDQERESSLDQDDPDPPQIYEKGEFCTSLDQDQILRSGIRLHRTELPQQHVCKEDEIVTDQERESSLDQDDPDSPQNEEEQEEFCTSLDQDDTDSPQIEEHEEFCTSLDQDDTDSPQIEEEQEEICTSLDQDDTDPPQIEEEQEELCTGLNQNHVLRPEIRLHRIEVPRQHGCKAEEILTDQELSNQERESSLDKDEPDSPQIEQEEELCTILNRYHILRPEIRLHRIEVPQQHVCKEEEILTDQERESSLDQDDHNSPQIEEEREEICTHMDQDDPDPPEIRKDQEEFCTSLNRVWRDETRLHTIELPQQYGHKEVEILADQELSNQERKSSLGQDAPDSPQFKKEQEGPCTSLYQNQLVLKQETETLMLTSTCEKCDSNEDQTLDFKPDETQFTEAKQGKPAGNQCLSDTCGKSFQNTAELPMHLRIHSELPQQLVCKEEEILAHQEFSNQERESSLDQGNKDSPQIKKEQEEPCTSLYQDQLVVKQETETLMLTVTCEKRDSNEAQTLKVSADKTRTAKQGKPKGKLRFKCDTCGKCFPYKYRLRLHLRTHTGERPYKCNACEKGFTNQHALTKHTRIHTGEKPFKCSTCGEEFRLSETLRNHMRFHPGENPYACHICGARFASMHKLKHHMKTHTDKTQEFMLTSTCEERDDHEAQTLKFIPVEIQITEAEKRKPTGTCYKCDTCGKSFSQQSKLRIHFRVHRYKKPYKCNFCEQEYLYKKELKKHMTIHKEAEQGKPTGKQCFKCDTCGKCFQHNQSLQMHQRFHTGEKLFSCNACDKKFLVISLLENHMRTHKGRQLYKCNTCEKRFSRVKELKFHVRTHTFQTYNCNHCGKTFTSRNALKEHIRTRIVDRFPCSVCDIELTTWTALTNHLRIHTSVERSSHLAIMRNRRQTYPCKTCKKRFIHLGTLKRHMMTHPGKKLPCNKCEREFTLIRSLRQHLRTHDREKCTDLLPITTDSSAH